MLKINDQLTVPLSEITISATRSQGPGGQNVNKVSTAIQLRFDIHASSLPGNLKQRLMQMSDHRITSEGVVVIKAQTHRSQDKNRAEALARLAELLRSASHVPRKRIPTRPTKAARRKRVDDKKHRASLKKLRGKPGDQG